jgi:large repetitive protein
MPVGEAGVAYNASLSASGGPTPYTWSLDSGALPGGLTLGSDGSVSGVPAASGTFTFTVKASDSTNQYTTQGATIKIAAHIAAHMLPQCATACYVEQGCVNVCGGFGTQSGGVGPFTYAATGNIPGGMTVKGFSLAGSFPSLAQFWQFTDTITDALGATASLSPVFYVYQHIAFSASTAICAGSYVAPCSARLPYSGGTPGVNPTVKIVGYKAYCTPTFCYPKPSAPPPNWSVVASGGTVTITVPANCARGCPNGWYGVVTLILVDSSPCAANTACSSGSADVTVTMAPG